MNTIITTALVQVPASMWEPINRNLASAQGAITTFAGVVISLIVIIVGFKSKSVGSTLMVAIVGVIVFLAVKGGLEDVADQVKPDLAASSTSLNVDAKKLPAESGVLWLM